MVKIIISLAILLLLISCGCNELTFDKNETFWTDVYEKGDILIFEGSNKESGQKLYDTIFITEKNVTMPTGDCNLLVSKYDKEFHLIKYKYKHGDVLSEEGYFIQHQKEKEGKSSLPILRLYDLEYNQNRLKDTTIMLKTGKKLSDCYTFHKKNSYQGWSHFNITSFVWSKEKGLVMYIGNSGEVYELVIKSKKHR